MNTNEMISKRLAVAIEAARLGGEYLLEMGRTASFTVSEKGENDFVTEADSGCEAIIIKTIKRHFPGDGIFAEESGSEAGVESGRWIIDPIDGTVNFSRSIPGYTISIAWELERYQPLVGVVYNPRHDELFCAAEGSGAFLNGQPIAVSTVTDPTRALIATVPPHRRRDRYGRYHEQAERLFLGTSDFRSYGSCALEMAYIAAGRLDGYYEMSLGYYDLAAGLALVREAGGMGTPVDERTPFTDTHCDVVASNGLIHAQILHMVQQ
ncbi:MAG: inositol monophosphatase family protein [Sphaerochaeta sp.]|jgi:myo-inositol-1(or 4)-monophosphatase|nr:inositol monophosphatase [Sphaerochaeta sp.]MDX9914413.1 inositol monophosphatase family protein [Sphaerochaeta sp.]